MNYGFLEKKRMQTIYWADSIKVVTEFYSPTFPCVYGSTL